MRRPLSEPCPTQCYGVGASTEYVTVTGTIPGPDLPRAMYGHAMVAINSTCSMFIGGSVDHSYGYHYASTFFYNHNEGELHHFGNWTNGPSLIQGRIFHAAGTVTDEVTDDHFIALTGGYNGNGYALDSTEILQNGEWVQGKIDDNI